MAQMTESSIDLDWHALSEQEIRQFDEQGYLIVRDVLNREMIDRIVEVGDRLIASNDREMRSGNSFKNCIVKDDAFIPLLTHSKSLSAVVQLLGAHIQLMVSHLVYKYPSDPSVKIRRPGWHRDYAAATKVFGDHVPRVLLKCAFYLNDMTQPNSGMTLVAPGTNRDGKPIDIPEGELGPKGYVEASLKAGDCLFFENRTAHAAGINTSCNVRKAIMFGYGYRWVMPLDYRSQEPAFLDKLDDLGQYLVGERYPKIEGYKAGGGDSPLTPWCEQNGAPEIRPVVEKRYGIDYGGSQ